MPTASCLPRVKSSSSMHLYRLALALPLTAGLPLVPLLPPLPLFPLQARFSCCHGPFRPPWPPYIGENRKEVLNSE